MPSVSLGEPAPLFSLPAINEAAAVSAVGRAQVELSDLVGIAPGHKANGVVLYFFDRAHGGAQLSALGRVQRQLSGKGVTVLAISVDQADLGDLSRWLEQDKVSVPVLRDEHGLVLGRYGVEASSLPMTVVIDEAGNTFAVGQPAKEGFEAELVGEATAAAK